MSDLLSKDERSPFRLNRLRLLQLLAERYAQSGDVMMPVRAQVVAALCEAAISLDIYAEDHDALKRLDKL